MTIQNSKIYSADVERSLFSINCIRTLADKSVFISGGNGLICSSVVDLLIAARSKLNIDIKIYLASRNIEKSKERFSMDESLVFVPYDATKKLDFTENADFYIHGASPASPDLFVKNPVETMISNIYGLQEILEKARTSSARVLYISSSEVYGKLPSLNPLKEDEYGAIDILNPRSSYGQSKRAAETLCASYIQEYNSDVVIVRPGHIYGPTASEKDKRVSSEFMYNAADGKNLVLKSKGEQLRSYTYCLDCASAILSVLLKGESGQAYNISNPNSIISIAQMANYFAKYSGVELKFDLPEEDEKKAFNPMNNSSLDSTKLESLGWNPSFTKEEGFEHCIQIIKELKSKVTTQKKQL